MSQPTPSAFSSGSVERAPSARPTPSLGPGFDPRKVPALPATRAEAPPPPERLLPSGLRDHVRCPPPWSPELRAEPVWVARTPVPAAVLMALVPRASGLMLVLTQRASHLSSHSGQIALPGGKLDPHEHDPVQAALREAHEEVGLNDPGVEVLGTLPLYTTGTGYAVTPVVALVPARALWAPNPGEVADLFEVPLSFLMNPANHRRHALEHEGQRREWYSMPWHDGHRERFIWGATAGMLRNLYRLLVTPAGPRG